MIVRIRHGWTTPRETPTLLTRCDDHSVHHDVIDHRPQPGHSRGRM